MKVTVDLPDELQQEVSFTLTGRALEYQMQTAVAAAMVEANATIKTLQDAAAEQAHVFDVLSTDSGALFDENKRFSKTIADQAEQIKQRDTTIDRQKTMLQEALAEIKRLEALKDTPKPPVIEPVPPAPPVVPVTPIKPIITKTELNFVAGACITLGLKAPSATVDATARELMRLISDMGFNTVRFFRNKDEVRDDLKRNPEDPRNLYSAAKKLNLVVVADTINRAVELYNDTELSQYLAGLKSLGAAALVFDDANQYVGLRKDGTPYPPDTLKDMVKRVRQFSDLPMIASVRANARVQDYKPLFEWVEFQTFGRLTELDDFLRLPADCFVFDGQSTVGNDYLRGAHDVILKYPPNAFFYYSSLDEDTDWRTMPDKVALIEKTVKAWNAARIVKAQPA